MKKGVLFRFNMVGKIEYYTISEPHFDFFKTVTDAECFFSFFFYALT